MINADGKGSLVLAEAGYGNVNVWVQECKRNLPACGYMLFSPDISLFSGIMNPEARRGKYGNAIGKPRSCATEKMMV
jgi:hypothetical protein